MTTEIAIILMSHGNFAKAAMESAELIVGKQQNYATLSVFTVDNINLLKQEMLDKCKQLDTSKGLLIFTDILGGTPMNLATHLITNEQVLVCCGLNLPLLLNVLMNRDADFTEMREIIETGYENGLTIRSMADLIRMEDEDDLL